MVSCFCCQWRHVTVHCWCCTVLNCFERNCLSVSFWDTILSLIKSKRHCAPLLPRLFKLWIKHGRVRGLHRMQTVAFQVFFFFWSYSSQDMLWGSGTPFVSVGPIYSDTWASWAGTAHALFSPLICGLIMSDPGQSDRWCVLQGRSLHWLPVRARVLDKPFGLKNVCLKDVSISEIKPDLVILLSIHLHFLFYHVCLVFLLWTLYFQWQ